ncbi:MAG: PASTA domain-containing protein [Clostridia bacterium]|nr:PASTA domain-containing protein [Clostridia bacterium]
MAFVPISNKKRILVILIFCLIAFLVIIWKLIDIQVINAAHFQELAYSQQTKEREVEAKRGTIYDTTGTRVLAQSVSTSKIVLYPVAIDNKEEVGKKLSEILEMNLDTVMNKVNKKSSSETLATNVSEEKVKLLLEYIAEKDVSGIKVDEDTTRVYPYGTMLSHTLGFTGTDNQGLYGLEAYYDEELTGVSGKIVGSFDGNGNETPYTNEQYVDAQDGKDIILSIDATIQSIAEKYITKACEENIAKYVNVVVMRPSTGEVLAIASAPTFDPNDPFTINDSDLASKWNDFTSEEKSAYLNAMWRNKVISDSAEPGSSFKIVTATAALEEGITDIDTKKFNCAGTMQIDKWSIKCWRYYNPHGVESLREGIMNSCNPVFMQVSSMMGIEKYNKYLEAFNLFGKTGIDLPGETNGIMHDPKTMTNVDLATTSFGQTIQITTLQTAVNYCAVANGGYLVTPYVVKEIKSKDGSYIEKTDSKVVKQIMSESTAADILSALEDTVNSGTAKAAKISGYRMAGKTATAEIGRGADSTYMAGFAGIAPVNNPELVCVVNIMDPQGPAGHQGSTLCGPVVASIIEESLRYLDIAPEYAIETSTTQEKAVPNLKGMTLEEASVALQNVGMSISADYAFDEGSVINDQNPKAGASLMEGSIVKVYKTEEEEKQMVAVPDVRNLSTSAAENAMKKAELNLRIIGSGYVLMQDPSPLDNIQKGSIVTVKCVDTLELP